MEGLYSKPCEYCPYCKDHVNNQFYKIAEFEDGGLEIWHSGERNASEKSPQGDMYILRITKNTGTDSNNLAPDLDVRQINCPRCRFKLSHVQKLMQSVPISFKKGLTGVCDQCAAKQTPQDPCYICAKTLKEFLTFEKEKWKRGQPPYFDREKPFLSKQGKGIEVTDMFKPTSSLRGWHSEDSLTKKATRGDYFPRDHMKETTRDKMFGSADIITGTAEPGKRADVYQKYKVPDFISGKRLPDDSEIRDQTWEHEKYKDQRGKRDLDQLKYEPIASTADIDPRTGTRVKQQKPVDSKVEEKEQFDQTTRVKPDKIFMKAKDQKDEKVERSEFQKGGIVHESSKDKAGEKVSRGGDGQSYERGKQIEHRDVDKKDKVDKTARDGKGDRSDKHAEQSKIKKSSKVDITSKDKNLGGGRGKDDDKGESARDKSKEKVTRGGESKEIGKKGEKTKSSETVRDKSKEKGDDAKEIDKKGAKTKPTIAEKSGKPDKTVRSGDSKGDETRRTAESSEAEKKEKIDKTSKDKSGDKSLGGGRGKDDEKNKIADQREGEKKGKDSTPRDKTGKKVTVDSSVKDDDKEGRGEKKARDSTPRDKTGKKVTVDSAVKDDDKEGRGEKKAKDSTSKDKSGKKVTTDSDVKDDDKEGRSEKKAKDSTSKDKTGKKVNDDEKEGRGVKKDKDSILKDKMGKKVTIDSDVKDDKKEGISKKSKPSEKDQFYESAKRGDGKSDKKKKDIDRSEGEKKGKSDKIGSKMSKDIGSEPEEDPTPRQRDHTTRDASGKKIKTPKGGEKEKGQAKPGEKTSREKDDEKEKGKAKKDIEKGKKSTSKEVDKKGHGKLKSDQGAKVEKKIYLKELDETKEKAPDDSLSVPADKVKIQQSSPDLITKLVQQRDRDRDKHEAETDELYLLPKLPKKRRIVHTAEMTDTDKESELELDRDEARLLAEETKEIIVGTHLLPRSEVHVKYEPPVVLTDFEEAYFPSVPLEATSETSQDLKKNIGVIRYALSDRTFIENGYTVLPTIKTFRKINLYRMRPANPEKNWFERNKGKGIITYCSGEKMAEIDEKGRGFLFYKNGRVALEYHDAEESNVQQRFIIRSSGEPDELGRTHPISVLGIFDHLGGGIVFDHAGKIRLKYNQSEGVVLDRKIGPLSHWQWHCLNDPPVLQQVVVDSKLLHLDPKITRLGMNDSHASRERDDESMLAIEYDNLVKENKKIRFKSYEPFQIRMKVVKINQQFSLRILDQSTIFIKFRDGNVNLKFNIGMILDNQEIVDTDFADLGVTPVMGLDKVPAHSDSVHQLQIDLLQRRNAERMLVERNMRIRNPKPVSQLSVDLHSAALSRPLRLPFIDFTDECNCKRRRIPSQNNIYYSTSGIG